jgi:hypothetical protein
MKTNKTEVINMFQNLTNDLNKLNKSEKTKLKKQLIKISKNEDIKIINVIIYHL